MYNLYVGIFYEAGVEVKLYARPRWRCEAEVEVQVHARPRWRCK